MSFPVLCDNADIAIGDVENIFIDTAFLLPMTTREKIEDTLINTDNNGLLSVMRKEVFPISKSMDSRIEEKLTHIQMLYKNLGIEL